MKEQKSGNLSIGDIISFVALFVLGITVFFGMNFMTLGNKIPSIVVALLLFIIMMVFIFLAAHAKQQDRNRETWKKVEYAMVGLYLLTLIPCYIYSAKFFDIQLKKDEITKIVNNDIEDINNMFAEYTKKCESRSNNFKTELEALYLSKEGRQQIVNMDEFKDLNISASELKRSNIDQIVSSFSDHLLKGRDISALKLEKKNLVENCETNFKSWNILFISQYVTELSEAKEKYSKELGEIYSKKKSAIEKEVPQFDTSSFVNESNIKSKFSNSSEFSVLGFMAVIILGILGMVKWMFSPSSRVIPLKNGSGDTITEDGGYKI